MEVILVFYEGDRDLVEVVLVFYEGYRDQVEVLLVFYEGRPGSSGGCPSLL